MRRNFVLKSKIAKRKETFRNELIRLAKFSLALTAARVTLQWNQNLNTICTQSMTDCTRDSIEYISSQLDDSFDSVTIIPVICTFPLFQTIFSQCEVHKMCTLNYWRHINGMLCILCQCILQLRRISKWFRIKYAAWKCAFQICCHWFDKPKHHWNLWISKYERVTNSVIRWSRIL